MFGITELSAYIIGTIAVIIVPGPNSLYCLMIAGQHGVKIAYHCIAGILLGDCLLMLATTLGMATLLKLYPMLFKAIQFVGGLYLAYIGWQLLYNAWQTWNQKAPPKKTHQIVLPQSVFKRALILSLTNPKAILFFLSFFVQFVDPNYPNPAISFLILALILQITSFTYLNILAFVGNQLTKMIKHEIKICSTAIVGMMFIGFAITLWLGKSFS